jgi:hypothetical protein
MKLAIRLATVSVSCLLGYFAAGINKRTLLLAP